MSFDLKGYLLEPPRVGTANSPFTSSPNTADENGDFKSNPNWPLGSEPWPRVDYMLLVMKDGLLADAEFGWTKNEVIARFDFDGSTQRYRTLPGGPPLQVGTIGPDLNTDRLKVPVPTQLDPHVAQAPWRLSVGSGSGVTFAEHNVDLVDLFGSPAQGHVEILKSTGELNWHLSDFIAHAGEPIQFQKQSFFGYAESSGRLGMAADDFLVLNPKPATGQYPLIRIGFDVWRTPVERATEGAFSPSPGADEVEWALDTGLLKLNLADAISGKAVYYDGVLMEAPRALPRQTLGSINAVPIPNLQFPTPVPGGDLIFRVSSGKQFPQVIYVNTYDVFGQADQVQLVTSGAITTPYFSVVDRTVFASQTVELVHGDFLVERGILFRFYRTAVNLTGVKIVDGGSKDVASVYNVVGSFFSDPMIGSPIVNLPQAPRSDGLMVVRVEQGTGTTLADPFPLLDGTVQLPVAGGPTYGYILDYDKKQLSYAMRRNNVMITLPQSTGAVVLPDPMVQTSSLTLDLESGVGMDVWSPLTIGQSCLFDNGMLVSFIGPTGPVVASGRGAFAGGVLTSPGSTFSGALVGGLLVVGSAVHTVTHVYPNGTTLEIDAVLTTGQVSYAIHKGKEVLADRYFAQVELSDPATKIERILTLGTIQNAQTVIPTGNATFQNTTTLRDMLTDFVETGVVPGDTIQITSGPMNNTYRTVAAVETNQLTVQTLFTDFGPATYTILRRLHIPTQWKDAFRVRYGGQWNSPYSQTPTVVARDELFTSPGSMAQGKVEISTQTGNLNFSFVDIGAGATVFWARTLKIKRDYTLQPALGFISFTERFLAYEEALLTYVVNDANGLPVTVVEPGHFLVRKELCQPRVDPTDTLYFNPSGRPVLSSPAPSVFRGGRPQTLNVQCVVDISNAAKANIRFLPDDILIKEIPHGATVAPIENVYVDYYVSGAMGGEQTLDTMQSPMVIAQVSIAQDDTNFVVTGNQTTKFTAGHLLRVDTTEVHLIKTVAYDGPTNRTTVTLVDGDLFGDAYTDPKLYLTSGLTRTQQAPFYPAYFATELAPFTLVSRGMNRVTLSGDRRTSYEAGTVIRFTDLLTFDHFYLLTASDLDEYGNTLLTLSSNTKQQYVPLTHTLCYSLRSILDDGATVVTTSEIPVLAQPYQLFRRVEGQPGAVLTEGPDYAIDPTGKIQYAPPLTQSEEISLFYTGHTMQPAGVRLRASYTALTVPTADNGLLNQRLVADYTLDSPDTFYFRVETMTNFVAEVSAEYKAAANSSAPSGGPQTSNSGGGSLPTSGQPSLWFDEGHLANEDFVARATLKWYNDTVNLLEDALQGMDGRVVGDLSGRFLFDGTVGTKRDTVGLIKNQIDDQLRISDAPYSFTLSPFGVVKLGTYQAMYLPGSWSRFYPTAAATFSFVLKGVNTGDQVFDTGRKNLTAVQGVRTRMAWAVVTEDAPLGAVTLTVDNSRGSATLVRPGFFTGMKCAIQHQGGTLSAYTEAAPIVVTPMTSTMLSVPALSETIPAGSTIYRIPVADPPNPPPPPPDPYKFTFYQPFRDYIFDLEAGQVLYVKPFVPFDGSIPGLIPDALVAQPLPEGQPVSVFVSFNNILTAPFKFPALYGEPLMDNGDQGFPIKSPSFDCEYKDIADPKAVPPTSTKIGHLQRVIDLLDPLTGIPSVTTPPYHGTGTLNVALDKIKIDGGGGFTAPVPKVHDLVRITTGANAGTPYRRIIAVTLSDTIQVDVAWDDPDTGFDFEVGVTGTIGQVSGNGTFDGATKVTVIGPMSFSTVQVGQTLVITEDPSPEKGFRRQVTAVDPAGTWLTFVGSAIPAGVQALRIDRSLVTFGGSNSMLAYLDTELVALRNLYQGPERTSLRAFFNQVFTNITTGTAGDTTNPIPPRITLTDMGIGVDFVARGVRVGHLIYIDCNTSDGWSGVRGVYEVKTVAAHVLTTDDSTPFPADATGISYRVVSSYGVTVKALQDIYRSLKKVEDEIGPVGTAHNMVATTFGVVMPPGVPDTLAFARGWLGPEPVTYRAHAQDRVAKLTAAGLGDTDTISGVLKSTDRLYDKRYAWIDARINLKSGILVKQQRAVDTRVETMAEIVNQLFKILSLG